MDAKCLREAGRFQGAIYLCGYALECKLKFCVCRSQGIEKMEEAEAKRLGHHLTELLDAAGLARVLAGQRELHVAFQDINDRWSTEMRYSGAKASSRDCDRFLKDSRALLIWLGTEPTS
jgi:hypothetical protein